MTLSRWPVPTAVLLALTITAADARAGHLLPIERSVASREAEAAKVRGLSINPMSKLSFHADHSLRTPQVKEAMRTLVRYLAAKRAQDVGGTDLSVLVYKKRFAVGRNGKIHQNSGGWNLPLKDPVTADTMGSVRAADVAASILKLASSIKRGKGAPTDEVYSNSLWD